MIDRDCEYTQKEVYEVYDRNRKSVALYSKLYKFLRDMDIIELNSVKADIIADIEIQKEKSGNITVAFTILNIVFGLINIFYPLSDLSTIMLSITGLFVIVLAVGSVVKAYNKITDKRQLKVRRNKYILCVIEDIMNEK